MLGVHRFLAFPLLIDVFFCITNLITLCCFCRVGFRSATPCTHRPTAAKDLLWGEQVCLTRRDTRSEKGLVLLFLRGFTTVSTTL